MNIIRVRPECERVNTVRVSFSGQGVTTVMDSANDDTLNVKGNPRHEDGGRERESSRDRYEQLHAPRGPPANPEHFESDEEWQEHHRKEKVGPMHHLPLVLVALPPLGAIIHG